jgi:hypothetical protein
LTADLYDPLHDRLEQILSALPVIESRDTIDDEANSMWDDLVLGKASTFLPDNNRSSPQLSRGRP